MLITRHDYLTLISEKQKVNFIQRCKFNNHIIVLKSCILLVERAALARTYIIWTQKNHRQKQNDSEGESDAPVMQKLIRIKNK